MHPSEESYQIELDKAYSFYAKGAFRETLSVLAGMESEGNTLSLLMRLKLTNLAGLCYFNLGEIKKAEKYSLQSLQLAQEYGDPVFIFKRYDNLAALYSFTKEYHLAHDYMQHSIDLKEATQHEKDLIPGLLQLAALFFYIDNVESGKETVKKAGQIMERYPPDEQLIMHYDFLLGMQYKREKKIHESLQQYDKAIEKSRALGFSLVECRSYTNQGDIYVSLEDWGRAQDRFEKALEISTTNHLSIDKQNIGIQLALTALKLGDISKCKEIYLRVREDIYQSGDDVLLKELESVGAEMYEAEGDYKSAIDAYKRHLNHYKKQYDNELSRNIVNIQAKYEAERGERQLKESRLLQVESDLKALKAEHDLQDTERRFRTMIENSTDGIVIMTAGRQPVYMSPYVYKILGYSEDEIAGVDAFPMVHPEDQDIATEMGLAVLANPGVPIHGHFRFPKKSGEYVWIEGTGINLLDDPVVQGVVCNFRDVSERKETESAIQELNKSLGTLVSERTSELEEVVKDLEAFSYSVSHDLRSPLRIIAGYAKLIQSDHAESLNEESREFIDIILDNTKRMGQLIDDLLNFSRMGRKALFKSPVDMKSMIGIVLDDLGRAMGHLPEQIIIDDLPPAYADHALIKQVWVNLLSNAVKYSSKKSTPTIEIGYMDQDGETVYFIKDNGAGFDMRFAHNLFGVFKRLHDRSDFDGIGVGLALAHRIIKMHEGRIWAEAEPDMGATFFFTLGPDA